MKCPYCGSKMQQIVLPMYPPIYRDKCTNPNCGASHDTQVKIPDEENIRESWTPPTGGVQ